MSTATMGVFTISIVIMAVAAAPKTSGRRRPERDRPRRLPSLRRLAAAFGRDQVGSSAVEFAIVAAPFIFLLVGVCQLGIYYMAQSALDTGVIKTAEVLRGNFVTGTTATLPGGSGLKSYVTNNAGGIISNNANLSVEIRQLATLNAGAVALVDGTADYGSNTSTLVLRAQATIPMFAPGLGSLAIVRSSALVRRQGT